MNPRIIDLQSFKSASFELLTTSHDLAPQWNNGCWNITAYIWSSSTKNWNWHWLSEMNPTVQLCRWNFIFFDGWSDNELWGRQTGTLPRTDVWHVWFCLQLLPAHVLGVRFGSPSNMLARFSLCREVPVLLRPLGSHRRIAATGKKEDDKINSLSKLHIYFYQWTDKLSCS